MAENNLDEVVVVESVIYIWLDDTIESSKQNHDTKIRLKQMVKGRLQIFANPDECVDYITTDITTQKIFFIVSNKFGKNVVPLIYDLPQIETIYVYCGNRQAAESWVKPHLKVGGIFTKQQDLLRQIGVDVGASGNDDQLPMSMFHLKDKQHSLQKLTVESTKFMWYQAILTILPLMAQYCNSKDEMVVVSKEFYHDDEFEKNRINVFDQSYTPTRAFWWYTSSSFVYRLLNRALRTQNIDIIFKFRFFVNDLDRQIRQLYREYLNNKPEKHLTVYRGQMMSMDEVKLLEKSINDVISMNSFLSTTQIRAVAELFSGADSPCKETSSLQSVLFIIDVYDINQDTTAFAFIKRYSCSEDEEEVLFTIGAILKVESVKQENNMWHVHLQLSRVQNQQHKDFSSYMVKQLGSEPGPASFGWFLYRMGDFKKAESYAEYIIKQFSLDGKETGDAYNLLGLIYKDLKRLEKSVDSYEKALDAYSRSSRSNSAQVIAIHHNISLAYLAMGDNRLAEDHRRDADSLLVNSSLTHNSLLIAMTRSLKAKMDMVHEDYPNALKNLQRCLEEKQKTLPTGPHPSIASTLNEIGIVQERMGDDNKALGYFKQALDICSKCLSGDHFDLAEYYANIGRIYYKREEYALALEQFETALKIITDATREENEDIVVILKCISDTNEKLSPLTNN